MGGFCRNCEAAQTYGLAKGLADAKEGSVAGTPAYMAPEQSRGAAPDAAADIKRMCWRGTDNWDALLPARAETSARLVLSDYTSKAIAAFRARGRKTIERPQPPEDLAGE